MSIFGLTVSFADSLWFSMYRNRSSSKRHNDKLGLNLLYVIIDINMVFSMGNKTLTCLRYDSSYDKIIVLLNFTFKWSLVNETCPIALVQAGTQANQLASTIDYTGKITNFLKTQKRRVLYFLCLSWKRCIRETSHLWRQFILCMFSLKT